MPFYEHFFRIKLSVNVTIAIFFCMVDSIQVANLYLSVTGSMVPSCIES